MSKLDEARQIVLLAPGHIVFHRRLSDGMLTQHRVSRVTPKRAYLGESEHTVLIRKYVEGDPLVEYPQASYSRCSFHADTPALRETYARQRLVRAVIVAVEEHANSLSSVSLRKIKALIENDYQIGDEDPVEYLKGVELPEPTLADEENPS